MTSPLRQELLRLADKNPALRRHIVPLKTAAFKPGAVARKMNQRLKEGYELILVFERGSQMVEHGGRVGADANRADLIGWGWGGKNFTGSWAGMTMPHGMQVRGSFSFSDDLEDALRKQGKKAGGKTAGTADTVVTALKAVMGDAFGPVTVSNPKKVKGEWGPATVVTVKAGSRSWTVSISHADGIANVWAR